MTCFQQALRIDPALLPDVWRGTDLAREAATVATGHAGLDAQLPGGGWPVGRLIEVMHRTPVQHVWRLVLPGLRERMTTNHGPVVLVGAPLHPFGPSLKDQGLSTERLLSIHTETAALRLWATEQALRCAHVSAVLAWIPVVRNEELRRLHLAAQRHGCLLFVFRPDKNRKEASPAVIRLSVQGIDVIEIEILKRRGPPVGAPVVLASTAPRLAALLQARRSNRSESTPRPEPERSHVLDRTAAIQ